MVTKLWLVLAAMLGACTSQQPEATSQKASKEEASNPPVAPAPNEGGRGDEDLKVIPPEIVSGGYLTCEEMPDSDAPKVYVRYGCNAFGGNKKRANLAGLKQTWKITDTKQTKVDAKRVEGEEAESEHCVWDVAKKAAAAGMNAQVLIEGKNGKSVTLKTKKVIRLED